MSLISDLSTRIIMGLNASATLQLSLQPYLFPYLKRLTYILAKVEYAERVHILEQRKYVWKHSSGYYLRPEI
jgi:hypothetical protein